MGKNAAGTACFGATQGMGGCVRWLRRRRQRRREGLRGQGLRRADARRADAEHVAERAEDGLELWSGGEESRYFWIGEEMAELGGAGGGFRHQDEQPGLAARQGVRLGLPLAGWARPARAGWNRRGCGVTGEAGGEAAQAGPDQGDERAGKPSQAAAAGDSLAQALDDEGKTVRRGERSGWMHENM